MMIDADDVFVGALVVFAAPAMSLTRVRARSLALYLGCRVDRGCER